MGHMSRPYPEMWVHPSLRLPTNDCQTPEGSGWGRGCGDPETPYPPVAQGGQGGSRLPSRGPGLSSPGLTRPCSAALCRPQAVPGLHVQGPFRATGMLAQYMALLAVGGSQVTLLHLCLEPPHNPTGPKARPREQFYSAPPTTIIAPGTHRHHLGLSLTAP